MEIKNEESFVRKVAAGIAVGLALQTLGLVAAGAYWKSQVEHQISATNDLAVQNAARIEQTSLRLIERTEDRFTRQNWEIEEAKINTRFERMQGDLTSRMDSISRKLDAIINRLLDEK